MTDVRSWLRAELEADREQIAAMTPADYARSAVDTVLTPGLVARSTVHACVYAINHAEQGAASTFSLFKRPLRAGCWRPRDDVQASLLSVLLLGVFATRLASLPADPLLAAVVGLQALPLVVDPLHAIAEVAG
jgi:hypothetical protein